MAITAASALLPGQLSAQSCTTTYFELAQAVNAQVMEYGGSGPRVGPGTGSAYWGAQLQAGMTVKDFVSTQVHSAEHKARFITGRDDRTALADLYRHLLAREPDDAAFNQLAPTGPQDWDALMDTLLNSAEYNSRFGLHVVPGDPVRAWDCTRASTLQVAHNQTFRDESQGSSMVTYATPAYVTLDQPRSLAFSYVSGTARPSALVQVNLVDNSGDAPARASIRVQVNGAWVTSEVFYSAGAGATLLSARFDASAYPSSALPVTAVVRKYWTDGRTAETLLPARVSIVNQRQSPFGSGWTLGGFQQLNDQGDGVFISDGAVGLWYWKQGCDGAGNCRYATPAGDLTTVTRVGATGEFVRTYRDGSSVRFSAAGRMTSAGDRFGNTSTYGYDGSGRLTSLTDPLGKVSTLSYTGAGALAWAEDPMGRRVNTTATGTSLWRFWAPDGSLALDMQMVQDATGAWMLDTYWLPSGDRSVAQWGWHYIYDAYGRVATFQQPIVTTTDAGSTRPAVTQVSLEKAVLPAAGTGTSTAPAARVQPQDVRVQVTDPRGGVTKVALDPFGSPTVIEQPMLRTTMMIRDRHGRVTRTDEPNGHYLTYTYFGGDLIRAKDNVANTEVNYEYEPVFHQLTRVSGTGTTEVVNTYDTTDVQRKLLTTRSGTSTSPLTTFSYTSRGRVHTITDPEGHATTFGYDATGVNATWNRVLVGTGMANLPPVRSNRVSLDRFGRDSLSISPGADSTRTHYDLLNRVQRTIGAAGGTITYTYTGGRLSQLRDPKGQTYGFHYNMIGATTSEVDPRSQATLYGYDRAGNATHVTNRRGQQVVVAYDSLGRPAYRDADGVRTNFTYGANDAWVQAANPVSTIRTEYNALSQPWRTLTTLGGITYTQTHTFDSQGRRTGLSVTGPWAGTDSMRLGYNTDGRLEQIKDFAGGVTGRVYNEDGQEEERWLPVGDRTLFGYSSTHGITESFPLWHSDLYRGYGLDANGRVSTMHRQYTDIYLGTGRIVRGYSYNKRGFLDYYDDMQYRPDAAVGCTASETDPNNGVCRPVPDPESPPPDLIAVRSYTYDRVGNRMGTGTVLESGNRIAATDGYTLTYDADGNMLRKLKGFTDDLQMGWNSLGQMISAYRLGQGSATYAYDPMGRRVQRTDGNGVVTRYLYDGDDLLMELDASGNRIREYTHLPGVDRPLSVRTWAAGQNGAAYYYVSENPGHVIGLLNTSNQMVNQYRYSPWGETELQNETVAQPFRYGSREWDASVGLLQVRARWYDPQLGRFVSEDPIGLAGGINPYAYVGNSPVNGTDPSGLCSRFVVSGGRMTLGSKEVTPLVYTCILNAQEHTFSYEALADFLGFGGGGRTGVAGGRASPGGRRSFAEIAVETWKKYGNSNMTIQGGFGPGGLASFSSNSECGVDITLGIGIGVGLEFSFGPGVQAGNTAGLGAALSGGLGNGLVGGSATVSASMGDSRHPGGLAAGAQAGFGYGLGGSLTANYTFTQIGCHTQHLR